MSYEEIVNGATEERRDYRNRRDFLIRYAFQFGGWLLFGLAMVLHFAARAC